MRNLVRASFGVVALALAVLLLARNWEEAVAAWQSVGTAATVAAVVFAVVGMFLGMLSWESVLRDIAHGLPRRASARIFFLGQLGKYIPGSVWTFVAQAELGRDHGISARRSTASLLLSTLVSLGSALSVALIALLLRGVAIGQYAWAFLALPVIAVLIHPAALNRLVAVAFRLLGKSGTLPSVSGPAVARSAFWSLAAWLMMGLQGAVLACSIAGFSWSLFLAALGGTALAWAVGFMVVFAPAGAGVREAVLVFVLAPPLSPVEALVVALMARLATVVADLALAAAATLAHRSEHEVGGNPQEGSASE